MGDGVKKRSAMTQESHTTEVAVSSSPAKAALLSDNKMEGWSWVSYVILLGFSPIMILAAVE